MRLTTLLAFAAALAFAAVADARSVRVAVGGEPAATALLIALAPRIAEATGADVAPAAQGDAEAAAALRDCRVDLAIMPSTEMLAGFEREGYLRAAPAPVMATDHVLVGPRRDPANARGSATPARALRAIAERRATFVSTGASGQRLEMSLWHAAGVDPRLGRGDWYLAADDGPAVARALRDGAYALLSRADWLSLGGDAVASVLVEGRPELAVAYQGAAVSAWRCKGVGGEAATTVLDWLRGSDGAAAIADWRIGPGAPFSALR